MSTLYDKLFESHVVHRGDDDSVLMFIDRHLVHEVTSPQAFEGMKNAGRPVRRPDCTLATVDHNVPTSNRTKFKDVSSFIAEPDSRLQCATLEENVRSFGLTYYGLSDRRQGIVHVIGPEQGFTLPGTTLVCGDSHSSTHGAFGCLAFGIGTSEVEHVLSTQTLLQSKSKNMLVRVEGDVGPGITSKDITLHIIGHIGTAGGTGAVIEFGGSAIRKLSMEARMSMCNMSIEGGARAGMVAPDEVTFEYLKGRPMAPQGEEWDKAVAYWKTLKSDDDAKWDRIVDIRAEDVQPTVTWGTSPQDVTGINGKVPDPAQIEDKQRRAAVERSLQYMGLEPNTPMEDVVIDKVFIGSCTNSRIEDLRLAASVVRGRHVAPNVYAMIVPGSGLVKEQAEREGLDVVFRTAGFDWREAGCSMCLGMNPDQLKPGERCASTSNRNFEGRQGPGGRTHLCSPAMAAAAAVTGRLTDVRKLEVVKDGDDKAKSKVAVTGDQVQLEDPEAPRPTDSTPAAPDQPADATHRSEATDAPAQSAAAPIHAASVGPTPPAGSAAASRAYTVLKGTAAPLDRQNIDTDLIIPARFLKTIKRTGLGTALFSALRYDPATGMEIPEFVLNKKEYRQAKILVVKGKNFGCGSSREHAPWALLDFGIRSVIAPSFADIFFNNTFKNGMLPIVLPQDQVDTLFADASSDNPEITIDLPNQVVIRPNGEKFSFEVDSFRKHCLVKGLDEIGLTLEKEEYIKKYEEKRRTEFSWLEGVVGRIKEQANQGNAKTKLEW